MLSVKNDIFGCELKVAFKTTIIKLQTVWAMTLLALLLFSVDATAQVSCSTFDRVGTLNATGIQIGAGGTDTSISSVTEAQNIHSAWLAAGSPATGLIGNGNDGTSQPADTTNTNIGVNYQIISLGFSSIEIDPIEADGANGWSEDGWRLNGSSYGSSSAPLSDNVVQMIAGSGNGDGQYDGDNNLSNETFFIDGVQYTYDGSSVYHNTVISFEDGSTATVSAVLFQDTAGNLYLAPESSNNADTTAYTSQPITSMQLGWQGSENNGLTLYRVIDSWVEFSGTNANNYFVIQSGSELVSRMDYGGLEGDFSGTLAFPGGVSGDNLLVYTSGIVKLTAGSYTINVFHNDGFNLVMESLSGDTIVFDKFANGTPGASNELRYENENNTSSAGSFTLSQDSVFALSSYYFEGINTEKFEVAITDTIRTDSGTNGYEILADGALNGKVTFQECAGTELVLQYTADVCSLDTNTIVDIVSGINATAQNGITTKANGRFCQSLEFSGDDSYATTPHNSLLELPDGAISLWFKIYDLNHSDNPDAGGVALLSKDSVNFSTGGHLDIRVDSLGQIHFRHQTTSESTEWQTNAVVQANTWHHLVYSFGSQGATVYVDNQVAYADPSYTNGLGTNSETLVLGATARLATKGEVDVSNFRDFLRGELDQIKFFKNQPSTNDVAAWYSESPSTCTDCTDVIDQCHEPGYQKVYGLDIDSVNYNTVVPYSVDNSSSIANGSFNRIAYRLELQKPNEASQCVWVSMDAFTNDATKIGVPSIAGSNSTFQQNLNNMNVFSDVSSIETGEGITTGNIEFWPFGYLSANTNGVPNASDDILDTGDTINSDDLYGSMQIHNHGANQTLFALNHFNVPSKDLGIGNRASADPDWTFASNANQYSVKNLDVYVSIDAVADYRFEDDRWTSAGDVLDSSGAGNHGDALGDASPFFDFAGETSCQVLSVDANTSSSIISAVDTNVDINTLGDDGTISFWYKNNEDWGVGADRQLLDASSQSNGDKYFFLVLQSDGSLKFGLEYANDSDLLATTGSYGFVADEWVHIAITWSTLDAALEIYVNGEKAVTTDSIEIPGGGTIDDLGTLHIGDNSSNYFVNGSSPNSANGHFDNVKIFDQVLSEAWIKDEMTFAAPCDVNLVAEYRFNENAWDSNSTDVIDSSGNGFNGTATGTQPVSGMMCNAADFDDSNVITVARNDEFDSIGKDNADYTVNLWVYPRSVNSNFQKVIRKGDASTDRTFSLWLLPNSTLTHHRVTTTANFNEGLDQVNNPLALNTWNMVTMVKTGNRLQTYINGVLNIEGNLAGESVSNTGALYIGDAPGLTGLDGSIDEVVIFKHALSADAIQKIHSNNQQYKRWNGEAISCPNQPIHHYEIVHDGNGLTCEAETVEVKACLNADCSALSIDPVILSLSLDGTPVSSASFVGSTTLSVSNTVEETSTLSIGSASIAPLNPEVCYDGLGNSCDIDFANAGFRFLYNGTSTIPNQTAGVRFPGTLQIQAVENTDGVCTGVFSGVTSVEFSQENVNPGGTSGLQFATRTLAIAKHPTRTSAFLNFGADSTAPILEPVYYDAGQIRLHAHYEQDGLSITGSSNAFWVAPAGFELSATASNIDINGSTSSSAVTHPAGENFTLTLRALNGAFPSAVTQNYQPGQLQLKLTRVAPTITGSVDGALSYAASSSISSSVSSAFTDITLPSFTSGSYTFSGAHYSEVGVINLAVQDTNYGNSNIIVPSTNINIGRFVPAYFTQTIAQQGSLHATCGFNIAFDAYSGQKSESDNSVGAISYLNPPILAITAYNKQGLVTQNYYQDSEGSANDFMRLNASSINFITPSTDVSAVGVDNNLLPLVANLNAVTLSQNDLTALPATIALPRGTLHAALSNDDNFYYVRSANSMVNPFVADIDIAIAGIQDLDNVVATSTQTVSPTGIDIRYGRLLPENSFGPETQNLAQHLKLQHFSNGQFVPSSYNNCVNFDASNVVLSNAGLDPNLSGVNNITGTFINGETRAIVLTSPGAGNQGNIGLTYQTYDWLQYDWNNNGLFNDNPNATASFGLYKGDTRLFHWRENQ